jgi:hypothetical protein
MRRLVQQLPGGLCTRPLFLSASLVRSAVQSAASHGGHGAAALEVRIDSTTPCPRSLKPRGYCPCRGSAIAMALRSASSQPAPDFGRETCLTCRR